MFKFIFNKQKGVTILESLIALTLLAVVAVGIFGVVLSISRKTNESDLREDAVLAMEQAMEKLQLYYAAYRYTGRDPESESPSAINSNLPNGLCAEAGTPDVLPLKKEDLHNISCLLPPVCDRAGNASTFTYRVSPNLQGLGRLKLNQSNSGPYGHDSDVAFFNNDDQGYYKVLNVNFNLMCNGYSYERNN